MTLILSGTDGVSDIDGTAATPAIRGTDANTGIFFPAADTIAFSEGGAEAMRIDSSGNVGIGVTPSAWNTFKGMQLVGGSLMSFSNAYVDLWQNSYYDGSNIRYVNTGYASYYRQNSGQHQWFTAASGTGGNVATFTQAMTLDASGNVGIGTTSPSSALEVYLADTTYVRARENLTNKTVGYQIVANGGTPTAVFSSNTATGEVRLGGIATNYFQTFYTSNAERMRIDSSGNVGVGITPSAWRTAGGEKVIQFDTGSVYCNSGNDIYLNNNWYLNSSAQNIYIETDFATSYSQQNGNHIWYTAPSGTAGNTITFTECARITSGGYFKASNNGTYWSSTAAYHELVSNNTNTAALVWSNNASASGDGFGIINKRSASNLCNLLAGYSNDATDVEFLLRNDGNGYADGTWNNNGADYAEFFESANGQALTLGATVVLDGNKVREATDQDPASAIIGVVRPKEPSKASMVVGNTAWNKWANKYLTDDFDRYIMEDHDVVEWEEQVLEKEAVAAVEAVVDEEGNEVSPAVPAQEAVYKTKQHSYESHNIPAGVTVPADAVRKTHDDKGNKFQHYKLNPAWDKDAEYVNRENRPEWNIIGLLGQVKILKGQPVGDRWIKMRDVSATVEEWMIR